MQCIYIIIEFVNTLRYLNMGVEAVIRSGPSYLNEVIASRLALFSQTIHACNWLIINYVNIWIMFGENGMRQRFSRLHAVAEHINPRIAPTNSQLATTADDRNTTGALLGL